MTKRELLRQINAICQELREVSRNSENPEELYDLNTMVENLKDQVEEEIREWKLKFPKNFVSWESTLAKAKWIP